MSKKKKTNPNRQPVTMADVNRAKQKATSDLMSFVWSIFFTVLRDKENYSLEDLRRVWMEVEDLSDSITKGYCTVGDIKHILKLEEGVVFQ